MNPIKKSVINSYLLPTSPKGTVKQTLSLAQGHQILSTHVGSTLITLSVLEPVTTKKVQTQFTVVRNGTPFDPTGLSPVGSVSEGKFVYHIFVKS